MSEVSPRATVWVPPFSSVRALGCLRSRCRSIAQWVVETCRMADRGTKEYVDKMQSKQVSVVVNGGGGGEKRVHG